MEKFIYKVTKQYIHEGLAALAIDELLGWGFYLLGIIMMHDYILPLVFPAFFTFVGLVLDTPLLIKCLIDRKQQNVIEVVGSFLDLYDEYPLTTKITQGGDGILATWYYPKEWHMFRCKLFFRANNGKKIKVRCVLSFAHNQDSVFSNIRGIQEKTDEDLLFQVKYLKYSKTLLSIKMISYPSSMKKRTKEYIDSNLSDLLKWVIKV